MLLLTAALTPSYAFTAGRAVAPPPRNCATRAPPRFAAARSIRAQAADDDDDDEYEEYYEDEYDDEYEEYELSLPELKDELLSLLADQPDRGIGSSAEDAEDLLEIVDDLEPLNPQPDWSNSALFPGRWRLAYTSSKGYQGNLGLTGYGKEFETMSTPETLMRVSKSPRIVVYEEALRYDEGSPNFSDRARLAALTGDMFGTPEKLVVEGAWRATYDGAMAVIVDRLVAGERSWEPADKQAKAIRVLAACTPVFLDETILCMRSTLPEVIFVFTRAGGS